MFCRRPALAPLWLLLLGCSGCGVATVSTYWGTKGELWTASGPITDYSHAGYGETGYLPDRNASNELTQQFALPQSNAAGADQTMALQNAIDALAAQVAQQNATTAPEQRKLGVLLLPAGDLYFSGALSLSHSNIVLRGSDQGHTTLHFERPKSEIDCEGLRLKLDCAWFKTTASCEAARAAIDCKWFETPTNCASGASKLDCRWSLINAFFQNLNSQLQCPAPPQAPSTSAACIFAQNLNYTAPLIPQAIVAHPTVTGCNMLTRRAGDPSSVYGYGGAMLTASGSNTGTLLGTIDQAVARGDTKIHFTVSSGGSVKPQAGQRVRIVADSPADGSLARELYSMTGNETVSANIVGSAGMESIDFSTKVVSVTGQWLEIERPLRVELRPGTWNPRIVDDKPTLENVGVENLTIAFPYLDYPGHHYERGFNAIQFNRATGCWVRDVTLVNMEDGIILGRSRNCTLEHISQRFELPAHKDSRLMALSNEEGRACFNTHEAYIFGDRSQDNLLAHFDYASGVRAIHGFTLSRLVAGNVITDGKPDVNDADADISLDHHGRAPFDNLFAELDVGKGARVWTCGGDGADRPEAGRYEVFWGLTTRNLIAPPPWARHTVLAGINTVAAAPVFTSAYSLEATSPLDIIPQNIYKAQLGKRICGGTAIPIGAEFTELCAHYAREPSSTGTGLLWKPLRRAIDSAVARVSMFLH